VADRLFLNGSGKRRPWGEIKMRGRLGLTGQQQLMASAAAIVMVASAPPAMAQTRSFNVPAGDASRNIPIFAKQAGVQILASGATVKGKRTRAVKGNMTVAEGLRRMLERSGLAPSGNANGIITIGAAPVGNGQTAGDDGEEVDEEGHGKAEILVIGGRSLNADVRRTEDDDQPYVVFGRADIQASQATSVEDFLRTRLPQNATFTGSNAQTTGGGSPYSSFNLRGLGSNQTLILVNGRRLAERSGANTAPGQADINGIPMASIERIEVLSSSAGGIYGGNAVGGVINIILRSDYRGVEVTATYNDTTDFKARDARLDVVGGFMLEGGRTSLTFSGTISRAGTLRVGDRRSLIEDGLALGYRNVPPTSNGTTPIGNGVNIRSTTGANLVLDPQYGGANLGSAVTFAPIGYSGVGSDNGAALVSRAGRFELSMPDDLNGLKRGLRTSSELESFGFGARRKFTDWLDIFIDYSLLQNRGTTFGVTQLPTTVTLAAAAPTNPFQQQITVTFPSLDYSFPFARDSRTHRLNSGTIIRLPGKWALNLEYNKNWSSATSVGYQNVTDSFLTACGFQASTATTCAGKPVVNPLQAPIDYGSYLFTEPTALVGPYRSEFDNPVLRASGPLFGLPGGSTTLTIALQRESSSIKHASDITFNTTTRARIYTFYSPRSQRTNSGYAEIAFPLVSAAQHIPLLREFELRGAVRHDDYLTVSAPLAAYLFTSADPDAVFPTYTPLESRFKSTNFTVAGRYSPLEGVVFRASYATGFLPPNVVQLANTTLALSQNTPDPFRGNLAEGYSFNQIIGLGNTGLRPEKSKSLALGVILTPVDGLRFSADYTRINKDGEIGAVPLAYLLANPDQFPGRVVRNPAPQPGDPAGFLGRIQSIDVSSINLFRSIYQSVDFQFDYALDTGSAGDFRFYALASWQPDSIRQTVALAPALNYVGNRNGSLAWQGNGGVDWTLGRLKVQWNTQYYHHYNVFNTADPNTAAGAASIASAVRLQGARRIPRQAYSDLYISYDFGDTGGVLSGMRISGGIQNIFDTKPPVVAISNYTGIGYSGYGDPRLRRFTASLRKSFGKH